MLLYQLRTVLILLMKVLLWLVFCCHNVLLLQRSTVQILLCSFSTGCPIGICVCVNVEWYSLVLCLYLWSQVVSHVPCALKVPDHVLELLVVKLCWCL